ncbi:MAG: BlaI/MecI/CopY family transcriptional regulator [Bacteroidota bacterium]
MIRLNRKEEEIMNIFWKLKKAFPKEIMEKVEPPPPPYNTVLSMIRKLEKDGFIDYHKIGKSHQYYPTISKRTYQKSILTHLLKDYFGGSPEKLLSFFIKEENLSEEEVNEILTKHKKNNKQ